MRPMILVWLCGMGVLGLACSNAAEAPRADAPTVEPEANANSLGSAGAMSVAAPEAPLLAGKAIYRPECFGGVDEEGQQYGGVGKGGGGYGAGPSGGVAQGGRQNRSAPATASAPPPPPSSKPSPVPAPAPKPMKSAESAASGPMDDAPASRGRGGADAGMLAPAAEAEPDLQDRKADASKKKESGDVSAVLETLGYAAGEEKDRRVVAANQPALDWGATVWLSNDDSMSLASAQRAIYTAQRGMTVPVSEIRPHELLNYFSFDTKQPTAGETFGVLAAARQDGDQIHLALSVKGAMPAPRPLDLTLVVDRSGSMSAEGRMEYTKRGLHVMEGSLNRGDRVDVVLFDDSVCTPLENYVVGRDDPALLTKVIDQLAPRGGTDMDIGLKEGYAVANRHEDTRGRNRRMMMVTDAMLNQGNVDPATVSEIGKAFETSGIRVTGVGVGREFNDKVLDMITEKGHGAYVYLGSEAVVDRVFGKTGFPSLVETVAHDVHFAIELPDSLGLERFYGEEASTNKEEVQAINYYAGTSQLFLQDLRIRDGKLVKTDTVKFLAEWNDPVTGEPQKRDWSTTVGAILDSDPHNVDKGLALMAWTDSLMAGAMGNGACGEAVDTYGSRAAKLTDDAEIAFVNDLVRKQCPDFEPKASLVAATSSLVPYKVKIDSDIPIAEVALVCAGQRKTDAVGGADTIASFQVPAGSCTITLTGNVDMNAAVEVPSTGGDARCVVRGGRVSCS